MVLESKDVRQYTALAIILVLCVFLAIALSQFITVFFGALILVTLFMPLHKYLLSRNISASKSAILICILITLIVALPLSLLSGVLIQEAGNAFQQSGRIAEQISSLDEAFPQYDIAEQVNEFLRTFTSSLQNILLSTVNQVTEIAIDMIVLYFLLYFFLVYHKETLQKAKDYIPFNRRNKAKLIEAFQRITKTTVLGAGFVALVQGAILSIGLAFIGIPNPLLLGFIGAIVSFLPVVGIALIWIPIAILQFMQGSFWGVLGVLITGGLISAVDYTLRPQFQQKKGQIHPLISILGVIIGIQYFGIFGIVVGPLLLSYAILIIDMFIEEYVPTQ